MEALADWFSVDAVGFKFLHRVVLIVMKIEILGYLAASDMLSRTTEKWDAIFIIDSGYEVNPGVSELTNRHLVLSFDDIELPQHGLVVCHQSHIERAISFAEGTGNLLVCCRAGQSRSAAIAYLIFSHYVNPVDALEILRPDRHRPNSRILDLGNQVLDEPALSFTIRKWRQEYAAQPMDLDKIEAELMKLVENGVTDLVSQPAS